MQFPRDLLKVSETLKSEIFIRTLVKTEEKLGQLYVFLGALPHTPWLTPAIDLSYNHVSCSCTVIDR